MSEKTLIIGDAGSSKTHWVRVTGNSIKDEWTSNSINPYVTGLTEMTASIASIPSEWRDQSALTEVFFYGAGCSSEANVNKVRNAFENTGTEFKHVFIGHDLLAAGRAICHHGRGIASILGTGSSSAFFDKGEIQQYIPPLGYVLGDEGGGVDLGKRLLVAILKKEAPEYLIRDFYGEFEVDVHAILEKIYFEDRPNKYLASFVPYILSKIDDAYVRNMVKESFQTFVAYNILKYDDCREVDVGFVGSVAFYFKDLLSEVLLENNLKPGAFLKSPMKGLVDYHVNA